MWQKFVPESLLRCVHLKIAHPASGIANKNQSTRSSGALIL